MACTLTEQVCDNRPKSAFINSDLRWHFRVKKTPHKTPVIIGDNRKHEFSEK